MENYQNSTAGQSLGIAGFVIGLVALILSFIPCFGFFALIPGLLAIIFSAIGLAQAARYNTPRGLAIAALVISIVAIIIAAVWGTVFVHTTRHHKGACEFIENVITDEDTTNDDLDTISNKLELRLDSLENTGTTVVINGDTLSCKQKHKLKESTEKAGREIKHAIKEFVKDLKEIEED